MNLVKTHDAAQEPISLDDVRNQLRIVAGQSDDDALEQFIVAIRHKVETFLGRTLITSIWQLKLDCFESLIELPMAPVSSVDSISYVDSNGDSQEFTDFQFDRSGRLMPSFNSVWPETRKQFDAVTITYTAGDEQVNQDIKLAMLLMIGACDINREDNLIGTIVAEIPNGAKNILLPYRSYKL